MQAVGELVDVARQVLGPCEGRDVAADAEEAPRAGEHDHPGVVGRRAAHGGEELVDGVEVHGLPRSASTRVIRATPSANA